jgi:hypothetical protein
MKLCTVIKVINFTVEISASFIKVEGRVVVDRFGQDVVQSGICVSILMGLWFLHHEGNIHMKEYFSHLIKLF